EQYEAILSALVESAQGKSYEALVAEVLERAAMASEGQPYRVYAENAIAQIKEIISNAENTVHEPAQTVSRESVPGRQENAAEAHQAGRAAATGTFDLTGQTAAEVEAEHRARAAQTAQVERQAAAPPSEEFTLTGSTRPADEARARGQMELAPAEEETAK